MGFKSRVKNFINAESKDALRILMFQATSAVSEDLNYIDQYQELDGSHTAWFYHNFDDEIRIDEIKEEFKLETKKNKKGAK